MKKAKFEKKTLSYPPEYDWQTPHVLEGAYCHGGIAIAKVGKAGTSWQIYIEKSGHRLSRKHAFKNLRSAKAAVTALADIAGIDWYSDDPLNDPYGRAFKTRENMDKVRQILESCERWA